MIFDTPSEEANQKPQAAVVNINISDIFCQLAKMHQVQKKTILSYTTVVQIREKSKQHSAVLSDQHFKYFRLRVKKYLENFCKKWNSSIIILITSIALGESCQNSLPPNGKDRTPLQWLPRFKRSNLTRKKPATNKEVKIQRNTP